MSAHAGDKAEMARLLNDARGGDNPPYFDEPLSEIVDGSSGELIVLAHIDPTGAAEADGRDIAEIGHKMAAAQDMFETLRDARFWLVEKYGSSTRVHDRSMWMNQSAFALYEKINASILTAEGEA